MRELDEAADRLTQVHPDQAETIYEHQKEITKCWSNLTAKDVTFTKASSSNVIDDQKCKVRSPMF